MIGVARFRKMPVGSPRASLRISPPTGTAVVRVIFAASSAARLAHTPKPCSE